MVLSNHRKLNGTELPNADFIQQISASWYGRLAAFSHIITIDCALGLLPSKPLSVTVASYRNLVSSWYRRRPGAYGCASGFNMSFTKKGPNGLIGFPWFDAVQQLAKTTEPDKERRFEYHQVPEQFSVRGFWEPYP